MKTLPQEQAFAIYHKVLDVEIDEITPRSDRRLHLDEFASEVRPFLKELGFTNRMISVVVPRYANVQAIEITLPRCNSPYPDRKTYNAMTEEQQEAVRQQYDAERELRREAQTKLGQIILAAFPKNDDRSDAQSDYYDYTFSVWH